MIDLNDLQRLVQRLQSNAVVSFECEGENGQLLRISLAPGGAGDQSVNEGEGAPSPCQDIRCVQDTLLRSPGMGVFCDHHPLGQWVPPREGDAVVAGQLLAFLHVAQVLMPVIVERDAVVVRRVADHGRLVGFADPLFELR